MGITGELTGNTRRVARLLATIVHFVFLMPVGCDHQPDADPRKWSPEQQTHISSQNPGLAGTEYAEPDCLSRADVTAFGATANDPSDDTAAFRAAISSLCTGGTVYIPSGEYRISTTLQLPPISIRIEGDGWSSHIRFEPKLLWSHEIAHEHATGSEGDEETEEHTETQGELTASSHRSSVPSPSLYASERVPICPPPGVELSGKPALFTRRPNPRLYKFSYTFRDFAATGSSLSGNCIDLSGPESTGYHIIEGLRIQGFTQHAIHTNKTYSMTVRECLIIGTGTGISCPHQCIYTNIQDTYFVSFKYCGVTIGKEKIADRLSGRNTIMNCVFDQIEEYEIHEETTAIAIKNSVQDYILGNHIERVTTGIRFGENSSISIVDGNYLTLCDDAVVLRGAPVGRFTFSSNAIVAGVENETGRQRLARVVDESNGSLWIGTNGAASVPAGPTGLVDGHPTGLSFAFDNAKNAKKVPFWKLYSGSLDLTDAGSIHVANVGELAYSIETVETVMAGGGIDLRGSAAKLDYAEQTEIRGIRAASGALGAVVLLFFTNNNVTLVNEFEFATIRSSDPLREKTPATLVLRDREDWRPNANDSIRLLRVSRDQWLEIGRSQSQGGYATGVGTRIP